MSIELPVIIIWGSLAVVFYAYVGFPVAIYVCSRLFGHRPVPQAIENVDDLPSVSILISALNEEDVIRDRLENALALDYPTNKLETVIASDGSIDRTGEIVQLYVNKYPNRIRLLSYSERRGKSTVLNISLPQLKSEIIVLSDANTMFEARAVLNLVRWFRDPTVGVVCGKLNLRDSKSRENVDGLYWRYESFLKECEGRLGALLGANGAIYAIRRSEFIPIPGDTIIDDLVIPLLSKLQFRNQIIYDMDAIAIEETAGDLNGEFHRRCRIGAGNFQCLFRLWQLILPVYGWMSFAFLSHKVLRWLCPAFLALALTSNFLMLDQLGYLLLLIAQLMFYVIAYIGIWLPASRVVPRILRLATMFAAMNLALAVGFWRWATGAQRGTWQRTAR